MFWIVYVVGAIIVFKLYQKFTCGICVSDTILVGKVAIVTGANTGVGFETAKDFAKRGARVILACRDEARGTDARERIVRETGATVLYRQLDLASLRSVRRFAAQVLAEERRLDILVNNAGVGSVNNRPTEDGIVVEMQVNHFGPFLLTNLLLPLLRKSPSSRIVNLSSVMHWFGTVDFDKIAVPTSGLRMKVYSNSKLCNILFTAELSRRLRAEGASVVANSVHPGVVNTDIYRTLPYPIRVIVNSIMANLFKSCWEGAQTSIYAAVAPDTAEVSGEYFVDCKPASVSAAARDTALAKKLWQVSEELVKLTPEERSL